MPCRPPRARSRRVALCALLGALAVARPSLADDLGSEDGTPVEDLPPVAFAGVGALVDVLHDDDRAWILDREGRVVRVDLHATSGTAHITGWTRFSDVISLAGTVSAPALVFPDRILQFNPETLAPAPPLAMEDFVICDGTGVVWTWEGTALRALVDGEVLTGELPAGAVGERACLVEREPDGDTAWLALYLDEQISLHRADARGVVSASYAWSGLPRFRFARARGSSTVILTDDAGSTVDARTGQTTEVEADAPMRCSLYAGSRPGCRPLPSEAIEPTRTPSGLRAEHACVDVARIVAADSSTWIALEPGDTAPRVAAFRVPEEGRVYGFVDHPTSACAVAACRPRDGGSHLQILDPSDGRLLEEAPLHGACAMEGTPLAGRMAWVDTAEDGTVRALWWDRRAFVVERGAPGLLRTTPAVGPSHLRFRVETASDPSCAGSAWSLVRSEEEATAAVLGPRCGAAPRLVAAFGLDRAAVAVLTRPAVVVSWAGDASGVGVFDEAEAIRWIAADGERAVGVAPVARRLCPAEEGCVDAEPDLAPGGALRVTPVGRWLRVGPASGMDDPLWLRFAENGAVVAWGEEVWASPFLQGRLVVDAQPHALPLAQGVAQGVIQWEPSVLSRFLQRLSAP